MLVRQRPQRLRGERPAARLQRELAAAGQHHGAVGADVVTDVDHPAELVQRRRARSPRRVSISWASTGPVLQRDEDHAAEVTDRHHPTGGRDLLAEPQLGARHASAGTSSGRPPRPSARICSRTAIRSRVCSGNRGPASGVGHPVASSAGSTASPAAGVAGSGAAAGNPGRSMNPSATPEARPTMAMSRASEKTEKREASTAGGTSRWSGTATRSATSATRRAAAGGTAGRTDRPRSARPPRTPTGRRRSSARPGGCRDRVRRP